MTILTSANGSLPLTLRKGETLVIRNYSGTETVTGSTVAREDVSSTTGSGAIAYGPQTSAATLTLSSSGSLDYQVVSGDLTPAVSALISQPTGQIVTPSGEVVGGNVDAIFVPKVATYGGIMDAVALAQTAIAAGKTAMVKFQPELYDISSAGIALPVLSGLTYEGSDYVLDSGLNITGGTIIQGNNTFDVFAANVTANGAPPATMSALHAEGVYSAHIRDLSIFRARRGITLGAKWKAGVYKGSVKRVRVVDNSDWGVYFENSQYSDFESISVGPQAGLGSGAGRWCSSIPTTLFNYGNHKIIGLFSEDGDYRTRGWCFHAYGGLGSSNGVAFNDINVFKAQRNCNGTKITVAATMVNGSADITVPDASVFPVDMPVTVSASVNGLSVNAVYFVIYSQGTTVRLSYMMGGESAHVSNGSTAVNLVTWGYQAMEWVGYGDTNNSNGRNYIQPSTAIALDLEGTGTNMLYLQRTAINAQIGTAFSGTVGGTSQATTVAARESTGTWASVALVTHDFDGSSCQQLIANNVNRYTSGGSMPGERPLGTFRDDSPNQYGINLSSNPNDGHWLSLKGVNNSGSGFVYPLQPMGQRTLIRNEASLSLNGQMAGSLGYTGTVNATRTLPTLSGNTEAVNTFVGCTFEIGNYSTTAGVTLTVNTAANQPFNRQPGKTSVVLAIGQSISLRAHNNNGADWFWQIVGASPGVTI